MSVLNVCLDSHSLIMIIMEVVTKLSKYAQVILYIVITTFTNSFL